LASNCRGKKVLWKEAFLKLCWKPQMKGMLSFRFTHDELPTIVTPMLLIVIRERRLSRKAHILLSLFCHLEQVSRAALRE